LFQINSFKQYLPTDYILPIVARSSIDGVPRTKEKPLAAVFHKTEGQTDSFQEKKFFRWNNNLWSRAFDVIINRINRKYNIIK
jgi:hypothetical protein